MTPTEYRTIRKKLGLTQAGLAALLGETRETISRRECSKNPIHGSAECALLWIAHQNISLYTVQRCRKDGGLYGYIHLSSDGDRTFCGQQTDDNWWILTNDASGVATCPKCKKMNLPNND